MPMNYDNVITWLAKKARREAQWSVIQAGLSLFGGLVALFFTWAAIRLATHYSLSWWLGRGHWSYVTVPSAMIPILLIGNLQTEPQGLSLTESLQQELRALDP